jgi:tetrahydromethanopterin S-methyltransferase subunit G
MFIKMLQQNEVLDIIKDEVLDGQPDVNELSDRLDSIEYELEQQDDYHTIDVVLDSMTFESRVKEIVSESLQDVTLDVKFDTTNL